MLDFSIRSRFLSVSFRFSLLDFSIRSRFLSVSFRFSLLAVSIDLVISSRVLVLSTCWYLIVATINRSIGPSTAAMIGPRSDKVTASMAPY